jgi:predicted Zn-dependent protease
MLDHLDALAAHLDARRAPGEAWTCWLAAEQSGFVRLNRGRVRQPGDVRQATLSLRLIQGRRHATADLSLAGELGQDAPRLDAALDQLRGLLRVCPEDPLLLLDQTPHQILRVEPGDPPPAAALVDALLAAAAEGADGPPDLVGVVASGRVSRGFAASWGARCWSDAGSFTADWCLVHDADQAVKSSIGGAAFDEGALRRELADARARLRAFRRPPHRISPGEHRAYLAPAAVGEVLGLLSWGGFSGRALATGTSPLARFGPGRERLSPRVHLSEHVAGGSAPPFQADGFLRPARVPLFDAGERVGALVSPRTAQELGLAHTGAGDGEGPDSLELAAGSLPVAQAHAALGTGLSISNLWYLNFSDRAACRITGMTRFATFWVEDGEIAAPVPVMRFDDTLGRVLGSALEALTDEAPLAPSTDTYEARSTASLRCPGALVSGFMLTL